MPWKGRDSLRDVAKGICKYLPMTYPLLSFTAKCLPALCLPIVLLIGQPAAAFNTDACTTLTHAPGVLEGTQPTVAPQLMVEPGIFGGEITCEVTASGTGEFAVTPTELVQPNDGLVAVYHPDMINLGLQRDDGRFSTIARCNVNTADGPVGIDPLGFNCFSDLFHGRNAGFQAYFDSEGFLERQIFIAILDERGLFRGQSDAATLFPLLAEENRYVSISVPDIDLDYLMAPLVPGLEYALISTEETATLLDAIVEFDRPIELSMILHGSLSHEVQADGTTTVFAFNDSSDPEISSVTVTSNPVDAGISIRALTFLRDAIFAQRGLQ